MKITRENAKELLPFVRALAEGKMIQDKIDGFTNWVDTDEINLEFEGHKILHRIKPESEYRPFKTKEECWQEMLKHQPFGWVKNEYSNIFNIIIVCENSLQVNEHNMNYSEFYKRFKFIDGTPFGIKED